MQLLREFYRTKAACHNQWLLRVDLEDGFSQSRDKSYCYVQTFSQRQTRAIMRSENLHPILPPLQKNMPFA